MADIGISAKCGETKVDLERIQWTDANGNGKPDKGEVKDTKTGRFVSGKELRCYNKLVNATKSSDAGSQLDISRDSRRSIRKIGDGGWKPIVRYLKRVAERDMQGPVDVSLSVDKAATPGNDPYGLGEAGLVVARLRVSGTKKDGTPFTKEIICRAFNPRRLGGGLLKQVMKEI